MNPSAVLWFGVLAVAPSEDPSVGPTVPPAGSPPAAVSVDPSTGPETPPAGSPPAAASVEEVVDAKGNRYALKLAARPVEEWDKDEAKALFEEGEAAYDDGRYHEAVEFWESSYAAEPTDNCVYSIGQAHSEVYEAEGDPVHYALAVARYGEYLQRAGTEKKYSATASANLNRLAALKVGETPPTRIVVSVDVDGAWMSIDGGPRMGADRGLDVEPGTRKVEVGAVGYRTHTQAYLVDEGQRLPIVVRLVPLPGALVVHGPRRATVTVDGVAHARLPLAGAIALAAGNHKVAVTKAGRIPYRLDIAVQPEQTIELDVETAPSTQRVLSLTLLGLGGGGLTAAAVTMGLAFRAQRDAQALESQRQQSSLVRTEYATYEREIRDRDRMRSGAIVSGVAGGSLVAAGLVLLLVEPTNEAQILGRRRGEGRRRWVMQPAFGTDYAAVVTTASF